MAKERLDAIWIRNDDNVRRQMSHFLFETKLSLDDVAREMDIHVRTLKYKLECPAKFTIFEHRQLKSIFRKYGQEFDMTLGEGAAAC